MAAASGTPFHQSRGRPGKVRPSVVPRAILPKSDWERQEQCPKPQFFSHKLPWGVEAEKSTRRMRKHGRYGHRHAQAGNGLCGS